MAGIPEKRESFSLRVASSTAPDEMMKQELTEERRDVARVRSLLTARAIFDGAAGGADCIVKNISDSGAQLIVSSGTSLPAVFNLFIPQRDQTIRVTVRWCKGAIYGVVFDRRKRDKSETDALVISLIARLDRLQSENEELRAQLLACAAPVAATD